MHGRVTQQQGGSRPHPELAPRRKHTFIWNAHLTTTMVHGCGFLGGAARPEPGSRCHGSRCHRSRCHRSRDGQVAAARCRRTAPARGPRFPCDGEAPAVPVVRRRGIRLWWIRALRWIGVSPCTGSTMKPGSTTQIPARTPGMGGGRGSRDHSGQRDARERHPRHDHRRRRPLAAAARSNKATPMVHRCCCDHHNGPSWWFASGSGAARAWGTGRVGFAGRRAGFAGRGRVRGASAVAGRQPSPGVSRRRASAFIALGNRATLVDGALASIMKVNIDRSVLRARMSVPVCIMVPKAGQPRCGRSKGKRHD
jgi:hypothetical protein